MPISSLLAVQSHALRPRHLLGPFVIQLITFTLSSLDDSGFHSISRNSLTEQHRHFRLLTSSFASKEPNICMLLHCPQTSGIFDQFEAMLAPRLEAVHVDGIPRAHTRGHPYETRREGTRSGGKRAQTVHI